MSQRVEIGPSWQERAEESRRLAAEEDDPPMRKVLLRLADAYEALAERGENGAATELHLVVGGTGLARAAE